MPNLENPFRKPILPPEQTDPEENAKLADTLLGKEYGDALRSLDAENDTKLHTPKQDDFLDMTLSEEELEVVNQSGVEKERKQMFDEAIAELKDLRQECGELKQVEDIETILSIIRIEVQAGSEPNKLFNQIKVEIGGIKDDYLKRTSLTRVAVAEAKAGLFDQSEATIEKGVYKEEKAFIEIAIAEAKAGRFDQAKQLLGIVFSGQPDVYQNAFADILITSAQAGFFDQVKKMTETMRDGFAKMNALLGVAIAEAKAGFDPIESFDEAKSILNAEKLNDDTKANRIFRIAVAEAQAGLFDQSRQTLESVSKRYYNKEAIEALDAIAIAKANTEIEVGLFDKAKQTLEDVSDRHSKGEVLGVIAIAEARAGLIDKFEQTIKIMTVNVSGFSISRDVLRGYRDIISIEIRAGTVPINSFFQAIKLIKSMGDVTQEFAFYENIAIVEAQAGRIEDAQKTMQKLSEKDQIPVRLAIIEAKIKKAKAMKTKQS